VLISFFPVPARCPYRSSGNPGQMVQSVQVKRVQRTRSSVLLAIATRAVEASRPAGSLPPWLKQGVPAAIIAAVLWVLYRMAKLRPKQGKLAPGPPLSLFSLAGHGLTVYNRFQDLPTYYYELAQKYGKVYRLTVGPTLAPLDNIVVTTQPDSLRHILKSNFDNYEKGADMFAWMEEIFGHGIFGVDGQAWYHQRKTASLIFTGDNVRTEMTRTMLNNGAVLVQALRDASHGGTKAVDIQQLFLSFTMDTFCEIGFGVQSNSLSANPPPEWREFADSFDGLQVHCPSRMFRPTWPLQRRLANLALKGWPLGFLCGVELEVAKMRKCVDTTLGGIIEQRLKAGALGRSFDINPNGDASPSASTPSRAQKSPKRGSSSKHDATKRLDLLELFMDVKPALSKEALRDVIKSLLVGGRDTTASTLTWAFFEIARNPEIERKCREEVKTLPMDDPSDFYAASKAWTYIDAVVRETIRLHSPVPIDAKHAINDDVLPDGTFVGKGWIAVYSPWVMARDTDLWGPDAATWRPERWLEGTLATQEPSPFVMTSFQAGPRICLGKDLAILEAKAVIAMLMHAGVNMRLWPTMGDGVPKYQMGVTMQVAAPGMLMKVTVDEVTMHGDENPQGSPPSETLVAKRKREAAEQAASQAAS